MSYYDWNGKDDPRAPGRLLGALIAEIWDLKKKYGNLPRGFF